MRKRFANITVIDWIFYLQVGTMPLLSAFTIDIGYTVRPSYIFAGLFLLYVFWKGVTKRQRVFPRTFLDVPIIAYVYIAIIFLILALFLYPTPHIGEIKTGMGARFSAFHPLYQLTLLLFFILCYYYMTVKYCSNIQKLTKILNIFFFTCFLVSIYGIYQIFAVYLNLPLKNINNSVTSGGGYSWDVVNEIAGWGMYFRPMSTFPESNNLAAYIMLCLPILISFITYNDEKFISKSLAIFYSFILFLTLFLSFSRANWFGFVISLLTGAILSRRYKEYVFITALILLLSCPIIIVIVYRIVNATYDPIQYQLNRVILAFDVKGGNRAEMIAVWWSVFKTHPIFGVGLSRYPIFAAQKLYSGVPVSPHGILQSVAADTGLIGLITFLIILLRYISRLLHIIRDKQYANYKSLTVGLLASYLGGVIYNLTSGNRIDFYLWFQMGLAVALIQILKRSKNEYVSRRIA